MKSRKGRSGRFLFWKNNLPLKNKNNRYHTLLIMSSSSGKRIVQLYFPAFLWWVSLVIVVAILVWAGSGTWSFYQHHQLTMHMNSLEQEKQRAHGKVSEQKREIAYLNRQLKGIQEQALYIRNYLGIGSAGTAKGKIGQGGGGEVSHWSFSEAASCVGEEQLIPPVQDLSQPARVSHQNIRQLEFNLDQIIQTLAERQQELEQTPSISPVQHEKAWISCGYGMRVSPFTGEKEFHPGVDIAGWKGTPVIAPANGTVSFARKWGSMGLTIKIRHNATYLTTYGHLLGSTVKKGQAVTRGDIIGYIGNSGRSTGYHLHYEINKDGKRINPYQYMADWKNKRTLMAADKNP